MTGRPMAPKDELQSWAHGVEERSCTNAQAKLPGLGIVEVPWNAPWTLSFLGDMPENVIVPLS